MTVRIPDFNLLTHPNAPFKANLSIIDMETYKILVTLENSFTVMSPIIIAEVRPKAQFSLID